MPSIVEEYFTESTDLWIGSLPNFQRTSLQTLLESGRTFEEAAEAWLFASASNTVAMGVGSKLPTKDSFIVSVKREIRAYLCGDPRYEAERAGLFGQNAATRTFVVSSIAVTIAPSLGVAAPVLSPIVALLLASIGKVTLNAWCSSTAESGDVTAS